MIIAIKKEEEEKDDMIWYPWQIGLDLIIRKGVIEKTIEYYKQGESKDWRDRQGPDHRL